MNKMNFKLKYATYICTMYDTSNFADLKLGNLFDFKCFPSVLSFTSCYKTKLPGHRCSQMLLSSCCLQLV